MKALEKVNKIKAEIAQFTDLLEDYNKRAKEDLKKSNQWRISWNKRNPTEKQYQPLLDEELSSTKESAVLKSAYKVLKYKLDKLILQ